MSRADDVFKPVLEGKKIPILTLDNKWHKLFTQGGMPDEIKANVDRLNALIKEQGRINTEVKKLKVVKKNLMDEIVPLAGDAENGSEDAAKKIAQNKKLIEECNEKIDEFQDTLLDLPRDINSVNYELMLQSMDICYDELKNNNEKIDQIGEWIKNVRIELKKNVIRKQEMEIKNHELYSYMHDIFGAEVIEIFDMKYIPEGVKKASANENKENANEAPKS